MLLKRIWQEHTFPQETQEADEQDREEPEYTLECRNTSHESRLGQKTIYIFSFRVFQRDELEVGMVLNQNKGIYMWLSRILETLYANLLCIHGILWPGCVFSNQSYDLGVVTVTGIQRDKRRKICHLEE